MDNQQEQQIHNNEQLKDHHRFSRNQNPEYDLDEDEQKQNKKTEYRQQLIDQIAENDIHKNRLIQKDLDETAAMDRKQNSEQIAMRQEFEQEHSSSTIEDDETPTMNANNGHKNGDNRRNLSSNIYSVMHTEPEKATDPNDRNWPNNTKCD